MFLAKLRKIANLSTNLRLPEGVNRREPGGRVVGAMAELDVQTDVLNFREEARGCLHLAQAETTNEVRTVLVGMAIGWLKLAQEVPRPLVSLSPPVTVEEEPPEKFLPRAGDYYTLMAEAIGALDPNTSDARRWLYERARAVLLTELRSADPSDIMAAQMLLELAIGEVEADAQGDQTASPRTIPAGEPNMRDKTSVHSRSFEPRSPAGARLAAKHHSAFSRPRPIAEKVVTFG
jgi:hypothetical protein